MEKIISKVVKGLFDLDIEIILTRPDTQFGDFSTNVALQIAKEVGKSPREVADDIAHKLRNNSIFSDVTVAGPGFINFRLTGRVLSNYLQSKWSDNYGENHDGRGKTVLVDFPSQNIAKPYSIGHLRPGNQGWAAKRLMEVTGHKVISDNHLGDFGAPFGVWVVGFLKFSSEEKLNKDGVYELGRIYIETKKALKDEAEKGESHLADQVQDWLIKLQNGDKEAKNYAKRFNDISLGHIHAVMNRLKISTDYELGEAFYVERGKKAVEDLIDRKLAERNDDGSVIVRLDGYGIDVPMLVEKSNGAALYATTDLGTLLYREETFKPSKVIYAVGAEQQFYFTQLFAMAKKIGIKTEMIHLWFGVIDQINDDGTREKMSSRKGVVLLEELLDKAEAKAREIVSGREVSDEDVQKIALGAIKFSDFTSDRRTNILFDWDNIFALSGFSGPYVQYSAVRVNKILNDNAKVGMFVGDYDFEAEKPLMLKLLEYPDTIKHAASELEPHRIAKYLYDLGRELNRYYEHTPVATKDVDEVTKTARLCLLKKISYVFSHGLSILGIEVPSKM